MEDSRRQAKPDNSNSNLFRQDQPPVFHHSMPRAARFGPHPQCNRSLFLKTPASSLHPKLEVNE
jgi:hypothetical protein